MDQKCSTCGRRNRSKYYEQCKRCRKIGADRARRNYHRRKRQELCVRCSAVMSTPVKSTRKRSYCSSCLDYMSQYW